ncbi:hypothetical protein [Bosea sp. TAF32]|uniref:hypothetical protein n=1 Tax=Bosea sp. TAF32 TaxID=3237482 RepID=UPI003F90E9F8
MFASLKGKISPKSQKASPERAVEFIRNLYPSKTAENVAYDTGVGAETIKKWLDGTARPGWDGIWPLIFAYGPSFLKAVYPKAPAWLDEAHRRERQESLRAEQRRIQEQLDALGA